MTIWLNGALVDAAIDPGFLTGEGVFETLRVVRSTPFAATRHLDRLAASAARLGLPLPDAAELRSAMDGVVAANSVVEGRMRLTVTRETALVTVGSLPTWPAVADVVAVPWPRNERGALAGVKTISYGENVVALAYARERGAGEALFGNLAGNLCEGTGTNVFVAVGGRLLTPPLSAGCLAGVTRQLVIELVGAEEADLPLTALASADEAFLTSSTRDVQPIASVDGAALGSVPGPFTAAAAAAFTDLMAYELDP